MLRTHKIRLPAIIVILSILFAFRFAGPKPTIFLIGDSTVRNGSLGNGAGGLWGWGSFFNERFDTTRIGIQNKAMGGTSSHSYAAIGLWDKVLADLKPGDFVIIQFGHNDNGKNSVRGMGEDTIHIINSRTKEMEIVHSFGWNLRRYIRDTKAKGATAFVCSLVPRNRWKNGRVIRDSTHAVWARMVAGEEAVFFIDLNAMVADHYDKIGQDQVMGRYFTEKDAVHTINDGAIETSIIVAEGLRKLKRSPLKKYLHPVKKNT